MSNAGNLPAQLREQGLFCCWRYEERGGKKTKVPYNPRTGGKAQSTNPATFTPLSVALRALERDGYDGIGVGVFGSLGAIDIDHCVSEAGELSPMAYDIIATMQGYTEFSPSGKGLRILFTVPEGFQYDKARYYINNQKAGLEVYIAGATQKYVTVTGNALTPGLDLGERGAQLAAVLGKYMVRPQAQRPTPPPAPLDWGAEIGSAVPMDLDDLELIQRAKRSKNGAQFAALWAGDTTGYKSASEADIALCNALAFWTNKDAARMDKLFRQSGLFRPEKWDRFTAGSTYGAITIRNAIATMTRLGYDPEAYQSAQVGHQRSNEGGQGIDQLLALFKPLEDFPEEEAKWLVPGWIPEGQISVIAADGGIGKTTLWCHVIAALSNGSACILDPPGYTREPMRITFLTTEDSVRKKLRKKLRLAGANMKNIITPDFVGDRSGLLRNLKFGTPEMDQVLRHLRPVLCVFDPVQGFTPPKVNMGSRNEMRDCMAPLISIGEDINTTALIVCHTNKRPKASGRDRIADSADLWDIARSVLMAGFTEEQGVRYLSNEKNNYGPLQETVLFTIDADGQIHKVGTSWKRDREYIMGAEQARSAPVREDCMAFIVKTLNEAGGAMPTAELEKKAELAGYSFSAVKRAKSSLKAERRVQYFHIGGPKDRVWYMRLLPTPEDDFEELPDGTPTPWDGQTGQLVLNGQV